MEECIKWVIKVQETKKRKNLKKIRKNSEIKPGIF